MSYPKWLYHADKEAVIVADEAQHKALGAGWEETPADFHKIEHAETVEHVHAPEAEKGEAHAAAEPAHVHKKRGRKPRTEGA